MKVVSRGYTSEDSVCRRARLKRGHRVNRITVRDLLGHFGVERRGAGKVQAIRDVLESLELTTQPDFEFAWIDEPIWLRLKDGAKTASVCEANDSDGSDEFILNSAPTTELKVEELAKEALISTEPDIAPHTETADRFHADDPTFRIGSLPAANKNLIAVNSDAPLSKAITLMLQYDFSQLPVMQGEREVKGIITWKTIGSRLMLGQSCHFVRDCKEDARIVDSNRTLFEAISTIVEFGYVLVRNQQDRRITGIVTASDLSLQFQELSEPFLLLREIELHIRQILRKRVTKTDFAVLEMAPPANRQLEDIEDLSLGQYVRLFQHPAVWDKLALNIDGSEFVSQLEHVLKIRNEVMHFDRDPMTRDQMDILKRTTRFMQTLYELVSKSEFDKSK